MLENKIFQLPKIYEKNHPSELWAGDDSFWTVSCFYFVLSSWPWRDWGALARCWSHYCSHSHYIWPQQKSLLTWPQPCSTRIFSSFVSCRKYVGSYIHATISCSRVYDGVGFNHLIKLENWHSLLGACWLNNTMHHILFHYI